MAVLCLASRGSPTETTSPLHQLDPARAPSLAEERLLLPVESRNILHSQCLDWNAKPLRGGCAFRKQRNMQWRMVSQHGVQFCVVGGGGARDVERCFFSSRRRHTRFDCDWSSDVCSSD